MHVAAATETSAVASFGDLSVEDFSLVMMSMEALAHGRGEPGPSP